MGQEIVHCTACGLRLRSSDFDRGDALRVETGAYCRACCPKPSQGDSRPSSTKSTRRRGHSTAHIPMVTPRHGTKSVSNPSNASARMWVGSIFILVLLVALMLVAFLSRREVPSPSTSEPMSKERPALPATLPRESAPSRGENRPAPPAPRAPAEAEELRVLDQRLDQAAGQERFRQAFDLLEAAKSRHDTLDWTAAIQRRTNDLDVASRNLLRDVQGKLEEARRRGAEAEAKAIIDRVSQWGLPDILADLEKPPSVRLEVPDATPRPAGAPQPLPTPGLPKPEKEAVVPFSTGQMKWTLLVPRSTTTSGGGMVTLLEDGSILVGGENPDQARHTLVLQTEVKGISAFRLEVLPDRSLFGGGPGRANNGNFVLSEFRVQLLSNPQAQSGTTVIFDRSASDFSQDGFPVSAAIDGKADTGWAISPQMGRAHEAIFETRAPLPSAGPLTLLVTLDQQSNYAQHTIGRFRISVSPARNASQEFSYRPTPAIDATRVDQAIQRAITWLRSAPYPPPDYPWSANELIVWTFIHAGIPESDPDLQRRLKQMLDGPLDRTYRVALQAMILEELDRVAYQQRLWQCAQFLVDNQCTNGQWNYGTPVELPKGTPSLAKAPVPTGAKLDADGRRLKPKLVRKIPVKKTRDGPAEGDNSNSQYAALGLRACYDSGIMIPEETILKAIKWWRESQYLDEAREGDPAAKGWSYTSLGKEPKASHSMTVGGISSLTIYDYMLGREWKREPALKAGVNWVTQSFTISNNYYYLYGLERAGVLYGIDKFGRNTWYPLGAQWILDHQSEGGGWFAHAWNKPDEVAWNTWDTCFAILFLRRATRPLVASEDPKSK